MKVHASSQEPPTFRVNVERIEATGRQRGIAIITVLAVLLLMSVLVLAFMSMASNEYTAANNYDYRIRTNAA